MMCPPPSSIHSQNTRWPSLRARLRASRASLRESSAQRRVRQRARASGGQNTRQTLRLCLHKSTRALQGDGNSVSATVAQEETMSKAQSNTKTTRAIDLGLKRCVVPTVRAGVLVSGFSHAVACKSKFGGQKRQTRQTHIGLILSAFTADPFSTAYGARKRPWSRLRRHSSALDPATTRSHEGK